MTFSFAMLVKSFRAISEKHHKSTIIISHQERIMQLADDIVVIADGRIREMDTKDEIFPRLISQVGSDASCNLRRGGKE